MVFLAKLFRPFGGCGSNFLALILGFFCKSEVRVER